MQIEILLFSYNPTLFMDLLELDSHTTDVFLIHENTQFETDFPFDIAEHMLLI